MSNENAGQWFVVQTLSGQENKAKESMEKQLLSQPPGFGVYQILIPTEKVSEVKQGKKITTIRKFFPGYILVRMDLYDADRRVKEDVWYFVKNTQGVIGFVGGKKAQERPLPISDKEVESLLFQVNERRESVVPKMQFDCGDKVRVKDGAFENFEGVINEMDKEKGKLKVLVSIFGRSTPVELEYWQVEKA